MKRLAIPWWGRMTGKGNQGSDVPRPSRIEGAGQQRLTLDEIVNADRQIYGSVIYTPCQYSPGLSQVSGQQVYLKLENDQWTGSFKDRGVMNKLLSLDKARRDRGIVVAGVKNLSHSAVQLTSALGLSCRIVVPASASEDQIARLDLPNTRFEWGGKNDEQAWTIARRLAVLHDQTLIHRFHDATVVAGYGTIGLEILRQLPSVNTIVVPAGSGALLSGIACAVRDMKPDVQVIGVESQNVPSISCALAENRPVQIRPMRTLASELECFQTPISTYALIRAYGIQIVRVTDNEIMTAMRVLYRKQQITVENSGAVAMAAVLANKLKGNLGNTVVVLSGGNISKQEFSTIMGLGPNKEVKFQIP